MRQQLMCSVAACAVMTAMSGPVAAADMPVKAAPAPALYAPNWTGWYIGGHLGWGQAKFNGNFGTGCSPCGSNIPLSHKTRGIVGGMHGGYNWQVNTFVYGLEADLSATGWGKSVALDINDTPKAIDNKVNLLASLRARLGMTFDRTLLYVTGGLAYTQAKVTATFSSARLAQDNLNKWGGVFGGGAEWKQNPNFSWRAEALYYIFNRSRQLRNHDDPPSQIVDIKLKNALVVRLGATYHFDGSGWGKGPIAARY